MSHHLDGLSTSPAVTETSLALPEVPSLKTLIWKAFREVLAVPGQMIQSFTELERERLEELLGKQITPKINT